MIADVPCYYVNFNIVSLLLDQGASRSAAPTLRRRQNERNHH
jgi:hypothetical protein